MNYYSIGPDCRNYALLGKVLTHGPFDHALVYSHLRKSANIVVDILDNLDEYIQIYLNKFYDIYPNYSDESYIDPFINIKGFKLVHQDVINDFNEYTKVLYRFLQLRKDLHNNNAKFIYNYDANFDNIHSINNLTSAYSDVLIISSEDDNLGGMVKYRVKDYSVSKFWDLIRSTPEHFSDDVSSITKLLAEL